MTKISTPCGGSDWHLDCIFVELKIFTENFSHPHLQNHKNFNINVYTNMLGHGRKFACLWTYFATTMSRVRGPDLNTYIWVVRGYVNLSTYTIKAHAQKRVDSRAQNLLVILNPTVINKMKRWAMWSSYDSLHWTLRIHNNSKSTPKTQWDCSWLLCIHRRTRRSLNSQIQVV